MIPLNRNLDPLQRSGIRVYTNLAKEVGGCVMLTIGEPDFDTPQAIKDALAASLAAGRTHYAPNQGTDELRKAIADFERRRGMEVDESRVLVTLGATGALFTGLLGILNPGDEVIIPTPAFLLYDTIVTVAGAKAVPLDLSKTGFQITKEALEAVMTPKTKAIILNSPNNPTGTVLSRESLDTVKEAVLGKPIYVVCDNVYNQLSYGDCPDLALDADLKEQLLVCQSFSKPYAMTGWRVGYLIAPGDVLSRLLLLNAAQIASVPTFIQDACVTALRTDISPMREIYRSRRDYVCQRLKDMGLTFPAPEGAFYVFVDVRKYGMTDTEFATRLIREAKVATVPGSCFGSDGFIRLSYCCSMEDLKEGLDRLEQFIRSTL